MFFRREFIKEDYKKKLLDLEFVLSVLVVLLLVGRLIVFIVYFFSGDIWILLGIVFYLFFVIWRLISNFLFSSLFFI